MASARPSWLVTDDCANESTQIRGERSCYCIWHLNRAQKNGRNKWNLVLSIDFDHYLIWIQLIVLHSLLVFAFLMWFAFDAMSLYFDQILIPMALTNVAYFPHPWCFHLLFQGNLDVEDYRSISPLNAVQLFFVFKIPFTSPAAASDHRRCNGNNGKLSGEREHR